MLGPDLLVAPVTEANAFSDHTRITVKDPSQFAPLNGPCRITAEGETIKLDMDFDGEGIKGARIPLQLQAGVCSIRFAYQADAGKVGIRLWNPEGGEVGDLRNDTIPAAKDWQSYNLQIRLPKAGLYSLYLGKAHASTGARHITFRNLTIFQKSPCPDANACWRREVYLPAGGWRDFWTGQNLEGGRHYVITATPEHPPVFVRDGTLLPLAEPLLTIDAKTVFTVHLAAYGGNPRPCQLLEDDGTTFDYEKGKWATLMIKADGTLDRPNHGQPQRYKITRPAENPAALLEDLLRDKPHGVKSGEDSR